MSYIKTFQEPVNARFYSWANTLNPSDLGYHQKSGWTITGKVVEDYYEWVNDFEAFHPIHGFIKGNFEEFVVADSEEAFNHFVKHHPPQEWDYGDI